jgi:CheY-like chemotaxis protein
VISSRDQATKSPKPLNGGEGVAKAKSERPNLIFMDIQLPVLDGYDTTRQIRADPNLKATPIIAVSSYAMKGDEEKARASGCDHYVSKPYSRSVVAGHPRLSRRSLTMTTAHRARIAGGGGLAARRIAVMRLIYRELILAVGIRAESLRCPV